MTTLVALGAGALVAGAGALAMPRRPARHVATPPAPTARRPPAAAPLVGALFVAALLVLATVSVPLAVAAAAVVLLRRATARSRARRARARQIMDGLADVLELVVLTVHAGCLPLQALATLAPVVGEPFASAFAGVCRRVERGERLSVAIGELVTRLGTPAAPLAQAFTAADVYGLPLAPTIEGLAEQARQHRRRRADAAARELPVRLAAPLVLCTLPSFVLVAIVPLLLGALSSLQL